MTNKEAIKQLKKMKSFHNGSYGLPIDIAIKALEKADKYRWHDLMNDPDDLPEEDGLYFLALQFKGMVIYLCQSYIKQCKEFTTTLKVIKWREIET